MRSLLPGAVAVLLIAGCTSSVTGTPTPVPQPVTASSPEAPGSVPIDPSADGELRVSDVAATPDGGLTALLIADSGSDARSAFVRLVPGDGGLTVVAVAEATTFAHPSELVVAPDGTVVALASVPPEAGDVALDGFDGPDLALAVLAPGSTQAELRQVAAVEGLGSPDSGNGVLSPDGATLVASLRWTVDGETVTRLATVDVATGEVTSTAPLGVESATAFDLALRPGGGVAALVTVLDGVDRTLLAEFDAALQPVRPPVELAAGGSGYALAVRPDGTVVVSVSPPAGEAETARLVVVRGDLVQTAAELPAVAIDLAVTADGAVHVSWTGADGAPTLATVDLVSGEVVGEVALCASGVAGPVGLSADGQAVLVTAACYEDGVPSDLALLVS
ncbi:hypothetical protein [Geodermatophilus sp. FMUSA9-8]|uniref:hypothetical protein n=1 Tax=Geodermatophilus sp. FMUSA9-8 TaxID=3120155 RepID=UPI00300AB9E9